MQVETTAGTIEGFRERDGFAFLGVPYAAPVTPALRFAAPQPVAPWRGVRRALRLGPVCPQIATYGPVGTGATSQLSSGTDFLTLNIRTPALAGAAPVLFWVHGGGYAVGSANEPLLQSGAFSASGIVEVTVNYRLGALGFLHLEDGSPDNRGLLDLVAALKWVRDNIAAFGGDPQRVTLAGRSAGGFAVAALMAMPMARGLFAKALPQSGASTAIATREDADRLRRRLLARLDLAENRLHDIAMDALLAAQRDLCNQSYESHDFDRDGNAAMLGVPFVPVIDARTLPEHPESAAENGRTADVAMMIGCTSAEYLTHSGILPDIDFSDTERLLHERVRPLGLDGAGITRRYRQALPQHGPQGIWRAVAGDLVFQNPAIRFARLHSERNPVFKYLYGAIEPDEKGAAHGAEAGAVWYRDGMDYSHLPARQAITDRDFAGAVHAIWVSFIRDEVPRNPLGAWPVYSREAPQLLRIESGRFRIENDPFDARPALWETA